MSLIDAAGNKRKTAHPIILKSQGGLEQHRSAALVTATRTEMAGATGLEPATFGVTGRRSRIKLNTSSGL